MTQHKQGLQHKQTQQLKLSPQQTQSLNILQYNRLDLEAEIQLMLEKNIMLQTDQEITFTTPDDNNETNNPQDNLDELDIDITWDDIDDSYADINQSNRDSQSFEPDWVSETISFEEKLEQSIFTAGFNPKEQSIITLLFDYLDEHYFLAESTQKIAKKHQIKTDLLNQTIEKLRHLNPAGVASCDIRECFLAQLNVINDNSPAYIDAYLIIKDYFGYLGKNHSLIQSRLGISQKEFQYAMEIIQSLSPYPNQSKTILAPSIKPDIYVYQKMGFFLASKNPSLDDRVLINKEYAELTKNCKGDEKKYMKAQLQEAKWFVDALQQRSSTIVKIANAVVLHQQAFFLEGDIAMRPLKISDIAKNVGLNESTVSRAVNGKYLKFKHRLYELKYFFSTSVKLENTEIGEAPSVITIKLMIHQLIDNEDKQKPISDATIKAHLQAKGFKVARRTIAKYREAEGIANASTRKKSNIN